MKPINEYKLELKKRSVQEGAEIVLQELLRKVRSGTPHHTDLMLLQVRRQRMEHMLRRGVISIEDAEPIRNDISSSLLDVIEELTTEHFEEQNESTGNQKMEKTLKQIEETSGRLEALKDKISLVGSLRRKRLEQKMQLLEKDYHILLKHIEILNESIKNEIDPIRKSQFQDQIAAKESDMTTIENNVEAIEKELG